MPRSKVKLASLCFVDARGGALAALAAGISQARGTPALAATTSAAVSIPPEIPAVLAEIGASAPEVVILPGGRAPSGERVDLSSWGLALHEGEGDLERHALARIARDRIERRLELDGR